MIYGHQSDYYQALQRGTEQTDSAPFIELMLKMILETVTTTPQVSPQVTPQVSCLLLAGWRWEVAPLKVMHQPGVVLSVPLISMDIEPDGHRMD